MADPMAVLPDPKSPGVGTALELTASIPIPFRRHPSSAEPTIGANQFFEDESQIMKPLLFILLVTGLGILVALQFGSKVTWFNYYAGAMAGLLVGSSTLGYWHKRKRMKELEEARTKRKRWQ